MDANVLVGNAKCPFDMFNYLKKDQPLIQGTSMKPEWLTFASTILTETNGAQPIQVGFHFS